MVGSNQILLIKNDIINDRTPHINNCLNFTLNHLSKQVYKANDKGNI